MSQFKTPAAGIAAATAVVGYDFLSGSRHATAEHDRLLIAVGCTGSTAASDGEAKIKVDGQERMTIINTGTGLAITRDHRLACREFIPRGKQLEVVVTDVWVTNPVALELVFAP